MTDLQAIKDRIDIVQLISEYIQLKKSGANWKGRCPFHQEKTPSFMVHPEKQIWHCFGCGKGGDAFSFVEEMEGLEFPEALKLLADRAGVKLEQYRNEIDKSQKNRLLEINSKAAYFFHHFLQDMDAAKPAREYLKERGLKPETIQKWQVGYIPDQWDLLTGYLLKKGNSIDDLVASGLTIKRDGANASSGRGFYDRFRGRIMFPLSDTHGSIVGFTGRILVEKENSGGKYVNTPQTIVYDKSRILYGLDKAKMEIKAKDLAVVVEGQMDVIACHQAGMSNVVASSGTALTEDQVRLLKRYSNNVAMAFDADLAGQEAAKRGIDTALLQGLNVKVIIVPSEVGKDADECLKKNPTAWFKAVSEAAGYMDWYFASVLKKYNLREPKQKQAAASLLVSQVVKIPQPVEQSEWLKKIGEQLDVDQSILRTELKKSQKFGVKKPETEKKESSGWLGENRQELLFNELWALLLKFPALYAGAREQLAEVNLVPAFAALYELAEKEYNKEGQINPEFLRNNQKETSQNIVDILLLQAENDYGELDPSRASKELAVLLEEIKKERIKQKRLELTRELKKTQENKDRGREEEILKQIMELN